MSSTNVIELPPAIAPEKTRDEFVEVLKILAHKLSQPLTCLRGSVEVALMGEIKEAECRQVLEQSLEESGRMAETLEMIRDVLETEGSEEDIQPVSWRRSIEKSLQEAAPADGECTLQLVCDASDEVCVKARPQHLDTATRRLLDWVFREARGNLPVRIELSACGETACLSICEGDLPPDAKRTEKSGRTHTLEEALEPRGLEVWMVRRAIERQGGWLKVNRMPGAGRCYRLYLPLAFSGMARHA